MDQQHHDHTGSLIFSGMLIANVMQNNINYNSIVAAFLSQGMDSNQARLAADAHFGINRAREARNARVGSAIFQVFWRPFLVAVVAFIFILIGLDLPASPFLSILMGGAVLSAFFFPGRLSELNFSRGIRHGHGPARGDDPSRVTKDDIVKCCRYCLGDVVLRGDVWKDPTGATFCRPGREHRGWGENRYCL